MNINYNKEYSKYKQKYLDLKHGGNHADNDSEDLDELSIIVKKIAQLLEDNYTFPKKIKNVKELLLSNLENGEYNKLKNKELYTRLYEDIYSVIKDKHVYFRPKFKKQTTPIVFDAEKWMKTKILNKIIGHVTLEGFPSFKRNKEVVTSATIEKFNHIKNCSIIVFDLRESRGGDPAMVQFLQSFLFSEKVLLNSIHWRIPQTDKYKITDYDTFNKKELEELTSNNNLPLFYTKKIFVLTSSKTFSAAEEFCYNLQSRKRGKIVGEITLGGANPGRMFDINDEITIKIPNGFAKNPITGTNWEGVGIIPDIKLKKEEALEYVINKFKKH
jgi:hypothetical protein